MDRARQRRWAPHKQSRDLDGRDVLAELSWSPMQLSARCVEQSEGTYQGLQ